MLPIVKTIHSGRQWTPSFHPFTECFAASTTFRLQCVLTVVNFGSSGHEKCLRPFSLTRKRLWGATDQMHKSWWQECEYIHKHIYINMKKKGMHVREMVLSARRSHSESSMSQTCVKVVCVCAELCLNLETLTPATCALKHFYASGWWKKSALFAAFLRSPSPFIVQRTETMRQDEWQVTADGIELPWCTALPIVSLPEPSFDPHPF